MQITQEELDRRLNSTKNLVNLPLDRSVREDKEEKQAPLSEGTRILAGSLAHQMPARVVAESLGIKITQVNSAKYSKNPNIQTGIASSLERIQDLAVEKLIHALGLMDNRMEDCSMKDLSSIAANMSRIIEKTRSPDEKAQVVLHLYSPEVRSPNSYKVIDV